MSEEFKPIIESVREFIGKCPYLPEFYNSLGLDRLEEEISSYSIDSVPCEPIVRSYVNGDSIRRFDFHFKSTEAYSPEILDQIANSAFFEQFSQWVEECSADKMLPELGEGKTATRIEVLTHGYVLDADETTAQYCIQCRLTYKQKRIRRKTS